MVLLKTMPMLPLTPVDPQFLLVHFKLGNYGDDTLTSIIMHVEFLFSRIGVLSWRINTAKHQETAECQKIRERKYAKGLEMKHFGRGTQTSIPLERRCTRRQ